MASAFSVLKVAKESVALAKIASHPPSWVGR